MRAQAQGQVMPNVFNVWKPAKQLIWTRMCLHTLLFRQKDAIEVAAKSVGLRWDVLNEGIAYALAPGLTDNKEEFDSLSESLVRTVLKGTPATDSYVQYYMVAVVIRPLLRGAIETGE